MVWKNNIIKLKHIQTAKEVSSWIQKDMKSTFEKQRRHKKLSSKIEWLWQT